MAHTLLRVLAADDPDLAVTWVAPPATAPLGERMPEVRATEVLDVPHGTFGWGPRRDLGRTLRGRFDRAIVLPNSWKSALLPAFARVPVRTGFVGEFRHGLLNDARRLDAGALPLMVERFAALAGPAGAPLPDPLPRPALRRDADAAAALRARLGLDDPAPVVAFCPGAEFGAAKRWPPAHFADLAAERVAAGEQVWLMGSPKDAETTAEIRAALPADASARVHDLAGRTRLVEAVDLLGEADAVVTNDSGLMHVAGALAVPTVAVYGSTSPGFTPPLGERSEAVALGLDCSPCFQRTCPLGHLDCLNGLAPALVAAALTRVRRDGPAVRAP
jgi:heptosyltransferase-2